MVDLVRSLCSGLCSLFSLISCLCVPYSQLSEHTGLLHTLKTTHSFWPQAFTLFSLGCYQLGEVAPYHFNLNRPHLFLFMLWFFFFPVNLFQIIIIFLYLPNISLKRVGSSCVLFTTLYQAPTTNRFRVVAHSF